MSTCHMLGIQTEIVGTFQTDDVTDFLAPTRDSGVEQE